MSRTILAAVAAALVALTAAPLANAAQNQFGGRAAVITGTVAGMPVSVVDTGPVQPGGDAVQASLLCYPAAPGCTIGVPDETGGAVQADVFHASAVAGGSRSHATATVADTALNVAGHTIQATFLAADADVSCSNGVASAAGSAEVAELVIDGQAIVVGGQANQSVPLPGGGNVVINEQGTSASANRGSADVSALHVIVPGVLGVGGTDVFVAKAHADTGCAPAPNSTCEAKDFVTGGGWVDPKKTFAVAGGKKNGLWWGHLEYTDHVGMRMHGTMVTDYAADPVVKNRRHIYGMADVYGVAGVVDGTSMPYHAIVDDNGEPGTQKGDTFELRLVEGSVASGPLKGGNIQLHHPCLTASSGEL